MGLSSARRSVKGGIVGSVRVRAWARVRVRVRARATGVSVGGTAWGRLRFRVTSAKSSGESVGSSTPGTSYISMQMPSSWHSEGVHACLCVCVCIHTYPHKHRPLH